MRKTMSQPSPTLILHQARLATSSINKRLPIDAEFAIQAEAQVKRNAEAKDVNMKVRFPDQIQVISKFHRYQKCFTRRLQQRSQRDRFGWM